MSILFLLSNLAHSYTFFDFNHRYFWKTNPQVVLCEDAKVNRDLVETAMRFWQSNSFTMRDDLIVKSCEKSHKKGEVRITHQRDLNIKKYYAYTIRDLDTDTNEISAATILIDDLESKNLELLIHEMGHALGINHSNYDKSHIMHKHVVDEHTRLY